MQGAAEHLPVLQCEVVSALALGPESIAVDATYGRGGHSAALLAKMGPRGRLLVMDRDPTAIAHAERHLANDPRVDIAHARFSQLRRLLEARGWYGRTHAILFDLGLCSAQLDDPARGFTFGADGPLDMRMDQSLGQSAAQWLATAAEADIARALREYGEEPAARRIARHIVAARQNAPLATTRQLAELVIAGGGRGKPGRHPATRTFQAVRIVVNGELAELRDVLPQALAALAVGGRLAVISFHSLEDRIVKRFLAAQARGDDYPPDLPVPADRLRPTLKLIGRARKASEREQADNPRSRSAVLRVAEKITD